MNMKKINIFNKTKLSELLFNENKLNISKSLREGKFYEKNNMQN